MHAHRGAASAPVVTDIWLSAFAPRLDAATAAAATAAAAAMATVGPDAKLPRYLLRVEYDGSAYSGWQRQQNARSVQGALEARMLYSQRLAPWC